MSRPRLNPYTEIGIRRVTCAMKGCRRKGYAQWNICANGNAFSALCYIHDIALNRLVLMWIGDRNAFLKMSKYSARIVAKVNAAA